VLEPAAAVRALPAVRERHDRHTVALRDSGDSGSDGDDLARELVAEDLWVLCSGQRMRLYRRDDRTRGVLVQIRAADAARRNTYHDVVGARRARLSHVLDPEVARTVEAEGLHG
jgi:hypothetical protein